MLVIQDEESRKRAQEVDCGVNHSWAAVYQSIARRMFSYLDKSESLKASTKELKEQVLSPTEPSVNIDRKGKREVKKHKIFYPDLQQTRSTRDLSRQHG